MSERRKNDDVGGSSSAQGREEAFDHSVGLVGV